MSAWYEKILELMTYNIDHSHLMVDKISQLFTIIKLLDLKPFSSVIVIWETIWSSVNSFPWKDWTISSTNITQFNVHYLVYKTICYFMSSCLLLSLIQSLQSPVSSSINTYLIVHKQHKSSFFCHTEFFLSSQGALRSSSNFCIFHLLYHKHETSSASSTVFLIYKGGSCSSSKGLLCNICWRDTKEAFCDPDNLLEPTMFPRLA